MQLRFEKCNPEHLKQLTQISRQTFIDAFGKDNNPDDFKNYIDQAFSEKTLQKELDNPDSSFYFVYKNTDLVGYFKINQNETQTELKSKNSLELERIYVSKDFQGQQIGECILNEVKKIAFQTQKEILWLGVWENNFKAIKFYEKHGFSKFSTHPYFIGEDEQTDWLMRFDVNNTIHLQNE